MELVDDVTIKELTVLKQWCWVYLSLIPAARVYRQLQPPGEQRRQKPLCSQTIQIKRGKGTLPYNFMTCSGFKFDFPSFHSPRLTKCSDLQE